jgi:hypothetical protein
MTYNEAPENLVEIHLFLDCFCYIPEVGPDGMIRFTKAYPARDSSMDFPKVKVPSEVVGSKYELTEYLRSKQEGGYEFVSLEDVNIWEDNIENPRGGKFRFG